MWIFAGVLHGEEASNVSGWSKTVIFFSVFAVYVFGSFRIKASIIKQYLVPHWLSTDPKTDDLE